MRTFGCTSSSWIMINAAGTWQRNLALSHLSYSQTNMHVIATFSLAMQKLRLEIYWGYKQLKDLMQLFIRHYKICEIIIAYRNTHTDWTHHIITYTCECARVILCACTHQPGTDLYNTRVLSGVCKSDMATLIKNINLYRPHKIDYISVIIMKNGNTVQLC